MQRYSLKLIIPKAAEVAFRLTAGQMGEYAEAIHLLEGATQRR